MRTKPLNFTDEAWERLMDELFSPSVAWEEPTRKGESNHTPPPKPMDTPLQVTTEA